MSWIVSLIVNAILSFLAKLGLAEIQKEQRYGDIKKQVQGTTSELKSADTEADREKATEDEAKNSF